MTILVFSEAALLAETEIVLAVGATPEVQLLEAVDPGESVTVHEDPAFSSLEQVVVKVVPRGRAVPT